ncbi:uncharacterized protein TNCV_4971641 [Trichonephila clavipes]|nr:uncharacterized protein TNCV_4971641 [Trichonephila clavipes]
MNVTPSPLMPPRHYTIFPNMPSPGFEPRPYGTAVSVTNDYTSKSSSFEAAGRGSQAGLRPTKSHTCLIGDIYPENKQAKEEVAYVGLNRTLEQSLQHVGVHYPAERSLNGCLEGRERLQAVALHERTCCY